VALIRLDIPDGSDEQALESFLDSLNQSARNGVRQMLLEGASEADIVGYIKSFEEQLADEEEASFEEAEATETPAS
jgi:cytochrome c-type biogenesis protein CcmH/NrfF